MSLHILNLSCFLLLLIPTQILSQDKSYVPPVPVDETSGKIIYRGVVQEPGSADTLYLRGINWINQSFTNPSDVTRVRDRENTLIRGTARMTLSRQDETNTRVNAGLVEYTFTIECRPDRYRYTFFDFLYKQTSRFPLEKWLDTNHPSWNPMMDNYLNQVHDHISKLIESLEESMKEKPKVVDDW